MPSSRGVFPELGKCLPQNSRSRLQISAGMMQHTPAVTFYLTPMILFKLFLLINELNQRTGGIDGHNFY